MIKCCKDCEERHPLCHSECERYNAEKAEQAERMKDWHNGRVCFEYRFDKDSKIKRGKMHKR